MPATPSANNHSLPIPESTVSSDVPFPDIITPNLPTFTVTDDALNCVSVSGPVTACDGTDANETGTAEALSSVLVTGPVTACDGTDANETGTAEALNSVLVTGPVTTCEGTDANETGTAEALI